MRSGRLKKIYSMESLRYPFEKIGTGGFEPPTPCMSSKYSTPELRA